MLTCGLKLTHDATIALIEDGRLRFSVEVEKLSNHRRHRSVKDLAEVTSVLNRFGCKPSDVDEFVIDGWQAEYPVTLKNGDEIVTLEVAPYKEKSLRDNVLTKHTFSGLKLDGKTYSYSSFSHLAGHIVSAWASSPFAKRQQSSYVLVWDGGTYPRLYHFDAQTLTVENFGHLFMFMGRIYAIFAQRFEPFRCETESSEKNLSVPGKVMAYIALGTVREDLIAEMWKTYDKHFEPTIEFSKKFSVAFEHRMQGRGVSNEDILASFHVFLERMLLQKLKEKAFQKKTGNHRNLCFVGGCALNIKWNSAIRSSGIYDDVWVPPFPNDTGSAIGAACCALIDNKAFRSLEWDVFCGPPIIADEPEPGWKRKPCSIPELAAHLHGSNKAVVFLNGSAELGPRALGNRSILAPAVAPAMKDFLNEAKGREHYRPVAPICLEQKAPAIFAPGCPDPYMLFDHKVRDEWRARIPAIIHLDGTARLQTVNERDNPTVASLLREYEKLSGIPLLCNTSANFKGCGFFPNVSSATKWGQVDAVWCQNVLYEKEQ